MITRRAFLKSLGLAALGTLAFGGYAIGIEPMRTRVQRYRLTPPGWPAGLRLRIAAIADVHACEPWMPLARIGEICATANALEPDVTVLLGDYQGGHRFVTKPIGARHWSQPYAALKAPLGVHAILGNHDWWDDRRVQETGVGPVLARRALERAGIPVYENDVVRLLKDGHAFWLAGLGDQMALRPGRGGRRHWQGVDDLPGTLAKVTDDAPVILLAHEPDIFPQVPEQVSLTLSGHTHGGQVRVFGYSPVVPSRFGDRYAYGHIVERQDRPDARPRHLIVSGGLGCSIAPVRFGVPPEIVLVELGEES